MTDTHDVERLLAELRHVKQGHEFTRDRIGQPGSPVRRQAEVHVGILDRAIAALSQQAERIEAEREAGRREGLRQAAEVAVRKQKNLYCTTSAAYNEGCRDVADAITALMDTPCS